MGRPFRRAILLALASFAASASGAGGQAVETITVSRTPLGLSSGDAPDFDVTLGADGQVAVRRRTLIAATLQSGLKMSERVERYRVSPADAAAFRASLAPHKPAEETWRIICGGKTYVTNAVLIRVPVFGIDWKDSAKTHSLGVCYLPQEQAIVAAIAKALAAVHLGLDGNRL